MAADKPVTRKAFRAAKTVTKKVDADRIGWQKPPYCNVPLYITSAGDDAVDLADGVGLHLDEWQQYVLRESLGYNDQGKYAAMEVGLLVPRQQGKTVIAEARELAGLVLFGERLVTHTAHLFDTAKESFLRMRALIEDNDDLNDLVHKFRTGNDDVAIEMKNGSRLKYKARSKGSGRGLSGDLVIFDEAYAVDQDNLAALIPALSAMPNPQIWYMSSTGMDDSDVLRKLSVRGRAGTSPRLAYFEWAAEDGCSLDDKEQWYRANPAYGIRLDDDFIQLERESMDDEEFARERLGMWASTSIASLIPASKWDALAYTKDKMSDGTATIVGPASFALDIDPDSTRAAIYAAGFNADGLYHVEKVESGEGVLWVPEFLKILQEKNECKSIAIDCVGPASALQSKLDDLGVQYTAMTAGNVAAAAQNFYNRVEDDSLRHRGLADPELKDAVGMGVKRPMGFKGAWAWIGKDIFANITPLVAATNALYAFEAFEGEPQRSGGFW